MSCITTLGYLRLCTMSYCVYNSYVYFKRYKLVISWTSSTLSQPKIYSVI